MISSLLSIKIRVHVIDNSNNEIGGGGVERDAGRDEKQLINFGWPKIVYPFVRTNPAAVILTFM